MALDPNVKAECQKAADCCGAAQNAVPKGSVGDLQDMNFWAPIILTVIQAVLARLAK